MGHILFGANVLAAAFIITNIRDAFELGFLWGVGFLFLFLANLFMALMIRRRMK